MSTTPDLPVDKAPPDLRVGTATDVGLVREHNEDALLARWPVYVVADGMGGHAAGEVASALAIDVITQRLGAVGLTLPTVEDVGAAAEQANRRIVDQGRARSDQAGMGTTLTGVVAVARADGSRAWAVVNVGDSRTYRYAEGALEQVSVDHSEVQELIDLGVLAPADARHHPLRNLLNRSLGVHDDVEPDLFLLTPHPGERFVVCSDGLSDLVEDEQIAGVLRGSPQDPQLAAEALVRAALDAGGVDNVTVVVLDV